MHSMTESIKETEMSTQNLHLTNLHLTSKILQVCILFRKSFPMNFSGWAASVINPRNCYKINWRKQTPTKLWPTKLIKCNSNISQIIWQKIMENSRQKTVTRRGSLKKVLKFLQNSQKTRVLKQLFNKAYNFIKKETPAQMFSCDLNKNCKNTF